MREDIVLWSCVAILIVAFIAFIIYREVRHRRILLREREKWAGSKESMR